MKWFRWSKPVDTEAEEHLRRLREDGFTVIRGGFPPGLLDEVLAA